MYVVFLKDDDIVEMLPDRDKAMAYIEETYKELAQDSIDFNAKVLPDKDDAFTALKGEVFLFDTEGNPGFLEDVFILKVFNEALEEEIHDRKEANDFDKKVKAIKEEEKLLEMQDKAKSLGYKLVPNE